MKRCKMLMLILFSIVLFSCSDKDDDPAKLEFETLAQTSWSGTLIQSYIKGETVKHSDVGFMFYSSEKGQYDVKYEDDPEPMRDHFTYSINDKLFHIKENVLLTGYWLLIDKNENQMTLEQSNGGGYSYKATLILNRKY